LPPKRKFRPRVRPSNIRDAKLIVIATEDTKATVKYLEDLREHYDNAGVDIHVVERDDMASSHALVMNSLNDFRRKYELKKNVEFWLLIDVDAWGEYKLSQIAEQCFQKKYYLSVSNPCFEIWLLLHLKSMDEYNDVVQKEFLENQKSRAGARRTRLEQELVALLGAYNKSNLDTEPFMKHVPLAIERAKAIDTNPADRWPQTLGTRIYLLAQKILPS
jgi:RloB-like protein